MPVPDYLSDGSAGHRINNGYHWVDYVDSQLVHGSIGVEPYDYWPLENSVYEYTDSKLKVWEHAILEDPVTFELTL